LDHKNRYIHRQPSDKCLSIVLEWNFVQLSKAGFLAGVNPTIANYNASVVNFYNATGSLARFENKNILFHFEKRCRLLQRWRCSCKLKNRRIGSRFHLRKLLQTW
jgi:hypothetical protein